MNSPAIERIDGRLRVRGPVTLTSVQTLLDQVSRLFSDHDVRVDWSGVTEMDSAAVALMLAWVREATSRHASLHFENVGEKLKTLITLYGVGEFLPIVWIHGHRCAP